MTTYKRTKVNYRKIYEDNFGPIPVDSDGRTYQIHHIDGNSHNNDPSNLKAVSIQEHLDTHLAQGDYYASLKIAAQMKLSPEEISELSSLNAKKQVQNGTHPGLKRPDGTSLTSDRVANNTHNFQKREDGSSFTSDRVKSNSHNWQKREDGTSHATDKVNDGTHNFLKNKGLIPCYNKLGEYMRISKDDYYSQIGPMEDWEWVLNNSKEGFKRNKIKNPDAKPTKLPQGMAGIVICYDKQGNIVKVDKHKYNKQTGPKENWEFVHNLSSEGKKRKEGLK